MFLYAAAISFSKSTGKVICFSDLKFLKYFKLSCSDNYLNKFKLLFFEKILHRNKRKERVNCRDSWTDQYDKLYSIQGHKEVWGYFQGNRYFCDYEALIRKRLTLKNRYIKVFNQKRNQLSDKPLIVVHVRRSDYKEFSLIYEGKKVENLQLPVSYYREVLDSTNLSNYQLVFISDEIEKVKQDFAQYDAYFSDNDFITDFQFLMNAEICILSNSSFSWWGAYLNNSKNKKIYIPKFYCGFKIKKEYPVNIIPKNWLQIELNYEYN